MAYSKEQIEQTFDEFHPIMDDTYKRNVINLELTREYLLKKYYNKNGARAANKKKYPDGYIYIVKLKGHDIYKIGVSNKPKRRIQDIDSHSAFGILVVGVWYFTNVYEMEAMIHDSLTELSHRKEWFKMSGWQINYTKGQIEKLCKEKTHLIKRDGSGKGK